MDRQTFIKSLFFLPFISFNKNQKPVSVEEVKQYLDVPRYFKGSIMHLNGDEYVHYKRPAKAVDCEIMYSRPCVLKYVHGEWFLITPIN